jgi:hypothetical protein
VTRRAAIIKLLMITGIAMVRGTTATAADWSETLDVSVNAAYDTNPALVPGSSIVDQAAQLAVDGITSAQTERGQLTITPHLAITRYARETNLDVDSGSLALGYVEKLERGQWSVSGQALTDSTLTSELGQTGITNVNFRHDAYTAAAGYQYFSTERLSWQLQGSGQITRYDNGQQFGLTNYDYGSIEAGPIWAFSDRLQGSLSVETDRVSPQTGLAQKDYSVDGQLKRSLSEKYSWRASVGATRVEAAGSASTPTNTVFELGASRQGERTQWDLSVKRAVLPIGIGLLAREDVAALSVSVQASERSTLNLAVNAIRSDPVSAVFYLAPQISFSYQVYSGASWGQAVAEWQYRFSPSWALSAAYQQARARNYSLAEWANGNQARLGIVWQSGRL